MRALARWVATVPVGAIPPDCAIRVHVEEFRLVVGWRAAGSRRRRPWAAVDICPHLDLPLTAFGPVEVRHDRLICPWHYWEFDLSTGQCRYAPLYQDDELFFFQIEGKHLPAGPSAGALRLLPARVRRGRVEVDIGALEVTSETEWEER